MNHPIRLRPPRATKKKAGPWPPAEYSLPSLDELDRIERGEAVEPAEPAGPSDSETAARYIGPPILLPVGGRLVVQPTENDR